MGSNPTGSSNHQDSIFCVCSRTDTERTGRIKNHISIKFHSRTRNYLKCGKVGSIPTLMSNGSVAQRQSRTLLRSRSRYRNSLLPQMDRLL